MQILLSLLFFIQLQKAFSAPLMCTMCSVGIASGLGIAKMLGVADEVIAIWLGATFLILSEWSILFLNKKNITNKFVHFITFLSSYVILIPLYIGETPKVKFNEVKTLYIDNFLFYTICGSLILFITQKYYQYIKAKNGKPHFPYEKVVLPLVVLIIFSLIINYVK